MKFEQTEAELLYRFVVLDPARHYFICHTIDAHKTFKAVWHLKGDCEDQMAVFLRHTGLIQVALSAGVRCINYETLFIRLLGSIEWQQAMVVKSVADVIQKHFDDLQVNEGAIIMKCSPKTFMAVPCGAHLENGLEIRSLKTEDLDEVVLLYQDVFTGFASKAYMMDKLGCGKGRAYGAFLQGRLIAVAQSDYESHNSALIVGVATVKHLQRSGYGKIIFKHLCEQLINEGKTLYLQYDSSIAGALYKRFGFSKIDQIYHIKKRHNRGDLI